MKKYQKHMKQGKGAFIIKFIYTGSVLIELRYDLTDTAGVLDNKVLGMFHGLDD